MTVSQKAERATPGRPAITNEAGPPRRWWALAAANLADRYGRRRLLAGSLVLFAVPQYFQSVDGITPLGTGIRLLPMALGLVIGTQLGGPLAKLSGVGTVIAAGFALAAAGLAAGATTGTGTGYGFAAGWIALFLPRRP
jgi:hypothetical protein